MAAGAAQLGWLDAFGYLAAREALGVVPVGPDKGALLAISERLCDVKGHASAWLWRGKRAKRFAIARLGDFEVTDLTILADGTVLTLERSFSATALPPSARRRPNSLR